MMHGEGGGPSAGEFFAMQQARWAAGLTDTYSGSGAGFTPDEGRYGEAALSRAQRDLATEIHWNRAGRYDVAYFLHICRRAGVNTKVDPTSDAHVAATKLVERIEADQATLLDAGRAVLNNSRLYAALWKLNPAPVDWSHSLGRAAEQNAAAVEQILEAARLDFSAVLGETIERLRKSHKAEAAPLPRFTQLLERRGWAMDGQPWKEEGKPYWITTRGRIWCRIITAASPIRRTSELVETTFPTTPALTNLESDVQRRMTLEVHERDTWRTLCSIGAMLDRLPN